MILQNILPWRPLICYTEKNGPERPASRFARRKGALQRRFRLFAGATGTMPAPNAEVKMELTLFPTPLSGRWDKRYKEFLSASGLRDEGDADVIGLMLDDDMRIVACGARAGHTLKQFAVAPELEGSGVFATMLSALQTDAVERGVTRLFLCTKPKNTAMLNSMGFDAIVKTDDAVLMENRRNGFGAFLDSIPRHERVCGAIVMNADPFTRGHLHLIEYAAAHCDALYVFAVSEGGSMFTPEERFDMIERGSAHVANRYVYSSDAYLVSRATFPAYFIRDESRVDAVRSDLDIELFRTRIAPALNITRRFVGQEPFSPTTKAYNDRMK